MKLIITDEARDDLARIAEWIARNNPRRAIAFIDGRTLIPPNEPDRLRFRHFNFA